MLVDRANTFLSDHPKAQDELRRIFTVKLATVREGEEPTRRRALRFGSRTRNGVWSASLPIIPTACSSRQHPRAGKPYAEVAHEAIFRRWDKLREWIAAEREFLAWKTGLEAARRAQSWLGRRRGDWPGRRPGVHRSERQAREQGESRARRERALVYVLLVGIIAGLVGWINQSYLKEQWKWYTIVRPYMVAQVRPYVLSPDAERALKPGNSFRECAKDCPETIVVPAGEFIMGSPANESGRDGDEGPRTTESQSPSPLPCPSST